MNAPFSAPGLLLRVEGAIVAVASGVIYSRLHQAGWLAFVLLFLSPDLFMLGYLRNAKFGSICYNVGHTYITPVILAGILLLTHNAQWLWTTCIWTAHIGFDRAIGYGLKYPTKFQDTHLQRL